MEKLVEVSEQEVRIEFALNCKCQASVRLRSLCATCPVAFKFQTSSPHKFLVNPPSGLIPPLSYATVQIILKPQFQLPPTFPRSPSDRFLIKTAEFTQNSPESCHDSESINSWFSSRTHLLNQDIKLKVSFVGPFLLRHAVSRGDSEAVKNIIKRQKSILSELTPKEAESLLRIATELVNPEHMVNLLLEAGLKIETRVRSDNVSYNPVDKRWESKGWNELHVAVAFDRTEEVLGLIKGRESGSLDCRDEKGRTALYLAASKGNIGCARVLLESGADKEAKSNGGKTALYRAAANGNRPMVEMLIENDADPTVADDRGRSAFDIARDKGHDVIVEIMERGEAVLMAARRGEVETLKSLLQKGASLTFEDQYGSTALHAAAMKGQKDAALVLMKFGSNLECRDNEGHTPLHLAVVGGCIETVEVLVEKGANVNAKSKSGVTPLYLAKAMGYDGVSQFLLKRGASFSLRPNSTTPSSSS